MKIGDLVRSVPYGILTQSGRVGIIIEKINHEPEVVPPVVKVLWNSGEIDKEWTDDLELLQMQGEKAWA